MQEFEHIKELLSEVEGDVAKCEAGNKAAGTRVRKQMQEVKRACQALRDKVMTLRGDAPGDEADDA